MYAELCNLSEEWSNDVMGSCGLGVPNASWLTLTCFLGHCDMPCMNQMHLLQVEHVGNTEIIKYATPG